MDDVGCLLDCLSSCLSLDNAQRRLAERDYQEKWTELPMSGVLFSRIVSSCEIDLPLRQLAAIALKKRASRDNCLQEEAHIVIESLFPVLLSSASNTLISKAVCMAIVSMSRKVVGSSPTVAAELVKRNLSLFNSEGCFSESIIRCLSMMAADIEQGSLSVPEGEALISHLFPHFLDILSQHQFSEESQSFAADGMYFLLRWSAMVESRYMFGVLSQGAPENATCTRLFTIIGCELSRGWEGGSFPEKAAHRLKVALCKLLSMLINEFPSKSAPFLPTLVMPHLWRCLSSLSIFYEKWVVWEELNVDDWIDPESGDIIGLQGLASHLLELFHSLIDSRKLRSVLEVHLGEIVSCLLTFIQLPREKEEEWIEDPNEYLSSEDDDFSPRVSASSLISRLSEEYFGQQVLTGFSNEAISTINSTGNWKRREAIYFSAATISEDLSRDSNFLAVFLPSLAQDVSISPTTVGGNVPQHTSFLESRALWCSSTFSSSIPSEMVSHFFEAISRIFQFNMGQEGHLSISSVAACASLYGFCSRSDTSLLGQHIPVMLKGLLSILAFSLNRPDGESFEDILILILDTLSTAVKVNERATFEEIDLILSTVLSTWSSHADDRIVSSSVCCLLEEICTLSSCLEAAWKLISPALIHIMSTVVSHLLSSGPASPIQIPLHLVEAAVTLAAVLAKHSRTFSGLTIQEPNPILRIFELSCDLVASSAEGSVVEEAGGCLSEFVRAFGSRLASWQVRVVDPNTRTFCTTDAASAIMGCLSHLLRPSLTEEIEEGGAIAAGPLMNSLIAGGHFPANLFPPLMKTVSERLCVPNSTPRLLNSLIISLSLLFFSQTSQVIDILASLTLSSGRDALTSVLEVWTKGHEDMVGSFCIKLSALTLAQIYSHWEDARLNSINVTLTMPDPNQGIVTRRRAKELRILSTQVPLRLRILQLLLQEHQLASGALEDVEGDEDDLPEHSISGNAFSSLVREMAGGNTFLDASAVFPDETDWRLEGEEGDSFMNEIDMKSHPLYPLNLKDSLEQFFRQEATNHRQELIQLGTKLTTDEQHLIQNIIKY